MNKILLIIGTGSHVLKNIKIDITYDFIYALDRTPVHRANLPSLQHIYFDLNSDPSISYSLVKSKIKDMIFDKIDIIFSSCDTSALRQNDDPSEIKECLSNNIVQPLNLFSSLSTDFVDKHINGIFISSMYAHVAPKPANYPSSEQVNPLYYGVSKAAVEQGIRWLSVQNPKHVFTSIALGPMPKTVAIQNQDFLVEPLLQSMPSGHFVTQDSLHRTINFILGLNDPSFRGSVITLDGGYTIL